MIQKSMLSLVPLLPIYFCNILISSQHCSVFPERSPWSWSLVHLIQIFVILAALALIPHTKLYLLILTVVSLSWKHIVMFNFNNPFLVLSIGYCSVTLFLDSLLCLLSLHMQFYSYKSFFKLISQQALTF